MMSRAVMPLAQQLDDGLAGAAGEAVAAAVDGRRRGRCRAATCPSASAALAIVLAVYMPPQAPSPGQIARSIASTSSRVIRPAGAGADRLERVDDRDVVSVPSDSLASPGRIEPA